MQAFNDEFTQILQSYHLSKAQIEQAWLHIFMFFTLADKCENEGKQDVLVYWAKYLDAKHYNPNAKAFYVDLIKLYITFLMAKGISQNSFSYI